MISITALADGGYRITVRQGNFSRWFDLTVDQAKYVSDFVRLDIENGRN